MLLDADILIDLLRQHSPAWTWFTALSDPPTISGIAGMELLFNCRDGIELGSVQTFLRPLPALWPSEADMQQANLYAPFLSPTAWDYLTRSSPLQPSATSCRWLLSM